MAREISSGAPAARAQWGRIEWAERSAAAGRPAAIQSVEKMPGRKNRLFSGKKISSGMGLKQNAVEMKISDPAINTLLHFDVLAVSLRSARARSSTSCTHLFKKKKKEN